MLGALALVAALSFALANTSIPRGFSGFVFLLIMLASAWWGGYGPGILATVVTLLLAPYLASNGRNVPRINATQFALVLAVSVLVSRVAAVRNEREAMLDERVRQRTKELERAMASLQERETLLLRQADELEKSNADLQQFAYVASHDLQEPLRLVAIYSELLRRRYGAKLDPEADQFLGVIVDGARRMETLIRDLLSYSRTIHAEAPVQCEMVQSGEALRIAVSNLDISIQESGAVIDSAELPALICNRVELTQLFQNLLSNALKYRRAEMPRITVSASRADGEWIFSVRDNGVGIHPDYHDAVFQPFKRLHGREFPGTGIGLALCRRVVERGGGRIWVQSDGQSGTEFLFAIPDRAPDHGSDTKTAAAVTEYSSDR